MVLAFATRPYGPNGPPTPETLSMVSGIISQGPLVHLTYPAAKVLRLIAAGLSRVAPGLPFPAPMPEEVRLFPLAAICPEALMRTGGGARRGSRTTRPSTSALRTTRSGDRAGRCSGCTTCSRRCVGLWPGRHLTELYAVDRAKSFLTQATSGGRRIFP